MAEEYFVLLDTETCSLAGGIIDLSFIVTESIEEMLELSKDQFSSKVVQSYFKNPISIEPEAFAVHQLSAKFLENFSFFDVQRDFYDKLYALTGEKDFCKYIIVGHNVKGFDAPRMGLIGFTDSEVGFMGSHIFIDTLNIARFLVSEKVLTHENKSCRLDELTSIYCSKEQTHLLSAHGATVDCWKTLKFLQVLLKDYIPNADTQALKALTLTTKEIKPAMKKSVLRKILNP